MLCLGAVYDVANRETFEALPKWFSEIDTYVSTTVPKIIVGNKVDKVLTIFSRSHLSIVFAPYPYTCSSCHCHVSTPSLLVYPVINC